MNSVVLEYRLQKGIDEFIPIYHYTHIDLQEILTRRECEFFIKEGVTYKQLSSAIEEGLFVIYVEKYEEDPIKESAPSQEGIKLEIRELNPFKDHPIIQTRWAMHHLEVLSIIGSIYTYYNEKEWERDSAEIDEDRKVYCLYVTPTGYKLPLSEGI
ncbi:hypothetical protein [Niallia sp. Krafla_26]|uniref:hypothetical protein n=1 Tax=Niallia sp. Krafla_26 TaxID=3064703 RepID=UPI003D176DFE